MPPSAGSPPLPSSERDPLSCRRQPLPYSRKARPQTCEEEAGRRVVRTKGNLGWDGRGESEVQSHGFGEEEEEKHAHAHHGLKLTFTNSARVVLCVLLALCHSGFGIADGLTISLKSVRR